MEKGGKNYAYLMVCFVIQLGKIFLPLSLDALNMCGPSRNSHGIHKFYGVYCSGRDLQITGFLPDWIGLDLDFILNWFQGKK